MKHHSYSKYTSQMCEYINRDGRVFWHIRCSFKTHVDVNGTEQVMYTADEYGTQSRGIMVRDVTGNDDITH